MQRGLAILAVVVCAVAGAAGQSGPAFEVASVKANRSGQGGSTTRFTPGGYQGRNVTLRFLIRSAYDVQDVQLVGAPAWIASERFDINATLTGDPSLEERQAMLRALLAERFKLVVRNESRELPTYALVRAKADGPLGPRIKASECEMKVDEPLPATPDGPVPCGAYLSSIGMVRARSVTLDRLASGLTPMVNRITTDRTGLAGTFDIELRWTPENLPQRAPGTPPGQAVQINGIAIDPDGPSIFTALQEQLGLKLDASKAVMPVLVIEGVERPTED